MTLAMIEITELCELRDELDSIITQIQEMNGRAESRVAKFNELGLSQDVREKVLNTLFSEE